MRTMCISFFICLYVLIYQGSSLSVLKMIYNQTLWGHLLYFLQNYDHDRMVVGFTTTYDNSDYHHYSYEL